MRPRPCLCVVLTSPRVCKHDALALPTDPYQWQVSVQIGPCQNCKGAIVRNLKAGQGKTMFAFVMGQDYLTR